MHPLLRISFLVIHLIPLLAREAGDKMITGGRLPEYSPVQFSSNTLIHSACLVPVPSWSCVLLRHFCHLPDSHALAAFCQFLSLLFEVCLFSLASGTYSWFVDKINENT